MASWETKNIGEIAQVKGGKRVPKGYKLETTPTAHPYITVTDFSDDGSIDNTKLRYISDEIYEQIKRYTISHKDLYISIAGTIGKTGYVPEELDGANLTENACKLVFNPGIDKTFVYYFTKTTDFITQTGINTRVAAQPKLALERLKTITLRVPPLPEQKRIVAILDEAFAGIDATIANTEKNLANARELFESYLNAVFAQKGDGWVEKTLKDLTTKIGSGATPRGGQAAYKEEGISLIRSLNVYDRHFTERKLAFIDDEQAAKLSNVVVEEGDVLFNITGASVARCCITPLEFLPARVNQHVAILRPRKEELETEFLCYLMTSKPYKDHLFGIGDEGGSTRQAITKSQLQNLVVAYPATLVEQANVTARLDALAEESKRLESIYQQKLTALAELKQSILQKAFAGELTSQPEKTVEKAVA